MTQIKISIKIKIVFKTNRKSLYGGVQPVILLRWPLPYTSLDKKFILDSSSATSKHKISKFSLNTTSPSRAWLRLNAPLSA